MLTGSASRPTGKQGDLMLQQIVLMLAAALNACSGQSAIKQACR
jgi:hypothetical protein